MSAAPETHLPYVQHGDWGFTLDPVHLRAVAQWRDAALADGWTGEAMSSEEGVGRRIRLTREGWVAHCITRESTEAGKKHEASISVWAPDGMAVKVPAFYSMHDLIARSRWCSRCKAKDVDTQRVGFAGRVCTPLNAERAKEEAAGQVRWLRPDYQVPRFAKGAAAKSGELDLGEAVVAIDKGLPTFPKDRYEQPLAVEAALMAAGRPMDAAELARGFKGRAKGTEQRIVQVLGTLARYGRVTALASGKFAARRAA